MGKAPRARRALERAVAQHYGRTPAGRMRAAGLLRAVTVLLRKHPTAAAEAAGAGVWQALRVGLAELRTRVAGPPRPHVVPGQDPPTAGELRRLRRFLDRDVRRRQAGDDASTEAAVGGDPT